MAERQPLVAANWKMHKTNEEAEAYLAELLPGVSSALAEIVICPPFTALKTVVEHCFGSRVKVAAQDMHEQAEGAFTGEVSAPMLSEVGVELVILGHSERRSLFGETDAALARKVPAAMGAGLAPILCVGETDEEHQAGRTESVVEAQLAADLEAVEGDRLGEVVIAYEPVWAIGTGNTATPEQAQEAIAFIRGRIAERDPAAGQATRVIYGGSVNAENAAELFSQPDVDGGLVGGASLDPAEFAAIVAAAG
jgi:triosephosphate isomerase (TIM)